MDLFSTLPVELLLLVTQHIDSFDHLLNLVHASPRILQLLNSSGPRLIDPIARACLEVEEHHFLTAIAQLRAQPVPPSCVTISDIENTYLNGIVSKERPLRLPNDTAPHLCLTLVSLAANIERLSVAVLRELLSRLSTLKLRHAVGKVYESAAKAVARPVSWVEHLRVKRSIWIIQVSLDIRRHASWVRSLEPDKQDPLAWSTREVGAWATMVPTVTQISMVLGAIGAELDPAWSRDPHASITSYSAARLPLHRLDSSVPQPTIEHSPRNDDVGMAWGQNTRALSECSSGYYFWVNRWSLSSIINLTKPMFFGFLHLGIAIWDAQRLCDLGLTIEPDMIQQLGRSEDRDWSRRRNAMSCKQQLYVWCDIGLQASGEPEERWSSMEFVKGFDPGT